MLRHDTLFFTHYITMEKIRITVTAKNTSTVLMLFLLDRLSSIEWIDLSNCLLSEMDSIDHDDLVITVLEEVPFQQMLDICAFYREKHINTIYLSCWGNDLLLGPTHFPGYSAGADSCYLFMKQAQLGRTPTAEELYSTTSSIIEQWQIEQHIDRFYLVFSELIGELSNIRSKSTVRKLKYVDNVVRFFLSENNRLGPISKYIFPLFENDDRRLLKDNIECKVLLNKNQHSMSHIEDRFFLDNVVDNEAKDTYRNVAIIGGGTSGYLAALAMKKKYPKLEVTMIESSKIPVIGVGEATTPEIRKFLFKRLGLSTVEFYKKVKPTWKLGIKFFWGLPGDYFFNYPFGKSDIRSAMLIDGNINNCSLTSLLMANDSSFLISTENAESGDPFFSLSNDISYALHLDNASFIAYLKEEAMRMGVKSIDDLIVDGERNTSNGELQAVIGEKGHRYEYEFFVDCSGFRSLLIEKVMGSPYHSFSNSLFTDSAVTGCIPNSNKVKPYTYAESMNNGWCWNIPMRGEDHRGYVYCSQYCTMEDAIKELESKNPGIVNFKSIKFRSGRHLEICRENVFAIGNSYAFVEPLESTGIHMIIKEVEALTDNFLLLKKSPSVKAAINRNMNDHWDYLKGFLSIHYKYNKKFDSKFWMDCRSQTDISSIKWLVDLYNEIGLLSYAGDKFGEIITKEIKDDIFGLLGFDTLLLGQGVIPDNFSRGVQNRNIWKANVKTWKAIQALTIPLEKDLKILTQRPELI